MPRRISLLLLALGLFAAACGGGGDDGTDSESSSTTTAQGGDDGDSASNTSSTAAPDVPLVPPTSRGPAPEVTVEPIPNLGAVVVIGGEPAYTGVLAQLDPERYVVSPAALPPADAAPGIAPLTGLPLTDATASERPAMVAKLDNTDKGRPQEALTQADIVYVTEIEGGFTRLVAVFHSQTPAVIGPVRSGRTTDIAVFRAFNNPIFVWSGANAIHLALIRRYEMVNMGAATRSEYFRAADRPGTYDLMTEPEVLWGIAEELEAGGAPPVHFEYRDELTGLPPTAVPVSEFRVDYPSATVEYVWDESAQSWRRSQDGTPHVDADDIDVAPVNVAVAEMSRVDTGTRDTAGAAVNEQQFIGSGRGWIFTDGHVVQVIWTKPSLASVPTWTTADGVPVALMPGQTWVELARPDSVTFS